ncbi:MAG: hypothetical protein UV71_C0012G0035 [Microgenomates group bacterium GW2011_GWC1_43_13]|uniref:Uncharacterized protein n=3 Tax=Candidatus Woeseibacteriota TaxID=1752722 RepID=A0A837IFT1_9BACT|nr:MAG: hypothetical protein UV71_C0012G0035 [Microgenomates group bacterium GW2011_GWC1_43_13]KKT33115.1 MAG: hypothetical protein UW20_C0005G0047 [Candidatus Woesebacteria bacterium GW2011_GWB1_44_11]KKT54777.1 MAG: hypothetical protein UW47_C0003G0046 [Candidatus Woesebacteria bacterium GW2011_GWA1_44_23]OGM76315.1 MAG: hypothetical protein A2208_01040 [Candidatus Woesebacteria bacterium RIFOXYA1_FULL_43_16]OGM81552.1 MAG: hypothetical protein A2394_01150 [Candidatus Woesebacteria bacterium 
MKKIFAILVVLILVIVPATTAFAGGNGFDQYGYNDNGNIFNGPASGWCLAGGQAANCMGVYSNDNLIMKWNEAWDACNDAGNNDPAVCAGAWTSNEWNGAFPGGSGEVWHYKIIWVGAATWNLTGNWGLNFVSTKYPGTYAHTLTVAADGSAIGASTGNTYTAAVSVAGNTVTIVATYLPGSGAYPYTYTANGTISAAGTIINGTWTATDGDNGTWYSTTGNAVLDEGSYWKNGGYRIWGNYEVVMDQGMSDGAHYWLTHATPNGYGN